MVLHPKGVESKLGKSSFRSQLGECWAWVVQMVVLDRNSCCAATSVADVCEHLLWLVTEIEGYSVRRVC